MYASSASVVLSLHTPACPSVSPVWPLSARACRRGTPAPLACHIAFSLHGSSTPKKWYVSAWALALVKQFLSQGQASFRIWVSRKSLPVCDMSGSVTAATSRNGKSPDGAIPSDTFSLQQSLLMLHDFHG
ncbi:hypothetical protein LX32DRAFT_66557 [Colletotrichum zoysiae]|uniref:Uncharacterized protein n=1 Tax=Colletotrichum zoysiae TaxID=1216348 RepID=A0AAD9LWU9_9PEZI|nr:hypothetical protein LX32DRAFT_66557 [Colletotrichum zoysiae]